VIDFRALFENAPSLFMVLGPGDGYPILAVSDRYTQATLTRREEIVGRPLFEVFPDNPEDPEASGQRNLAASLEQVIATHQPHRMAVQKYDVRGPGGVFQERWWSPVNYPLLQDGQLTCIIHSVEDVTELERAYQKLQHTDRLKTQFFANVSHELRTPLTLILGPVDRLLAAQGLTPEGVRQLESIRRNAWMLLKLVNDLLDLSKLDAGKLQAAPTAGDLAGHVRLTLANFETVAEQRGIRLQLEAPSQLPAEYDPDMLTRILGNLLSNALKFTPAGGVVRCTLTTRDADVVLEVGDSGPGIPEDQREAVFERFRQVDGQATRRVGGTGLGLPIVQEFAQLQGGYVGLGQAPEGGALFTVTLPLREPSGAAEQATADLRGAVEELSQLELPTELPQEVGRACVLVVEDNPEMRAYLAQTLTEHYNVATARDGLEGLRKARELRPDAIVTDLMMPGMSGDELVRALREEDGLHDVPVMLLTARADEDLKVRLLREGAQDYLAKPFWPEELKARVANLITIRLAREMLERELARRSEDLSDIVRGLQRHLAVTRS